MECSPSKTLAIPAISRREMPSCVFNLSHSLGLVMFGGAFLYISIFHSSLFSQSSLLQGCSILVSAAYLIMSLKFWFSNPAIGSGISMGCFILAAAFSYA
jgi:hypothetical protein